MGVPQICRWESEEVLAWAINSQLKLHLWMCSKFPVSVQSDVSFKHLCVSPPLLASSSSDSFCVRVLLQTANGAVKHRWRNFAAVSDMRPQNASTGPDDRMANQRCVEISAKSLETWKRLRFYSPRRITPHLGMKNEAYVGMFSTWFKGGKLS